MEQRREIAAIINNEIRLALQRFDIQRLELLGRRVVLGEYRNTVLHQCRTYIILRRERVGACNGHFRTARLNDLGQISRFGFQMKRDRDFEPFERLLRLELLANPVQHRHMLAYPVDFEMSFGCERHVGYNTVLPG
ncbi:hypothetical protein D3C71_1338410 [compost metagenome]